MATNGYLNTIGMMTRPAAIPPVTYTFMLQPNINDAKSNHVRRQAKIYRRELLRLGVSKKGLVLSSVDPTCGYASFVATSDFRGQRGRRKRAQAARLFS